MPIYYLHPKRKGGFMQEKNKKILKNIENLLKLQENMQKATNSIEKQLNKYINDIVNTIKQSAENYDLLLNYYTENVNENKVNSNFFNIDNNSNINEAFGLAAGLATTKSTAELLNLSFNTQNDNISNVVFNEDDLPNDLFDVDLTDLL